MSSLRLGLHAVRLGQHRSTCGIGRIGRRVEDDLSRSIRSFASSSSSTSPLYFDRPSRSLDYPKRYIPSSRRYESTAPSSSKPAVPTSLAPSSPAQQPDPDRPKQGAISRFTQLFSLAGDKSNASPEENASSSVKKLLSLARPEAGALSIGAGLVSTP